MYPLGPFTVFDDRHLRSRISYPMRDFFSFVRSIGGHNYGAQSQNRCVSCNKS